MDPADGGAAQEGWFPSGANDTPGWRLDVVTLLAVIGESSVTDHAQAITASFLCMLPRIIPAPQALLKPSRPLRMPEVTAKMAGVYSGVVLDTVGFFANIIHPLDKLMPFSFKVLEIRHKDPDVAWGGAHTRTGSHVSHRSALGHANGHERRGIPKPPPTDEPVLRQHPQHEGQNNNVASEKKPAAVEPSVAVDEKRVADDTVNVGDMSFDSTTTAAVSMGTGSARPPAPPPLKRGLVRGITFVEGASPVSPTTVPSSSLPGTGTSTALDLEGGPRPLQRRLTLSEKATDYLANPRVATFRSTMATTTERPAVPAKLFSPVHVLSVLSCVLSLGGIGLAAYWHDGTGLLALVLLSVTTSMTGYASWWRPILMNRSHTNKVPKGDVVIRTREGAFVLVRCTEEVARELYAGTEECDYRVGGRVYRSLMGVGTVLLMVSVVLLGNCSWNMQVFIGGAYVTLNGAYWGLGLLPRKYFWDLSRYEWEDVTPADARGAEATTDDRDKREGTRSYTRTLWYVIRETKLTGWVTRSGAAPGTDQWRAWLAEAEANAKEGNRKWKAVGRKDDIMRDGAEEVAPGEWEYSWNGVAGHDSASQHAPAVEVQPRNGSVAERYPQSF